MRTLVCAAHPDDETYGMGATIRKLSNSGHEVGVISFTNGVGARSRYTKEEVRSRESASHEASKILGFVWVRQFDFRDNQMDSVPLIEIIRQIEEVSRDFSPDEVYTHFHGDLNVDHQTVARATLTAFRPLPTSQISKIAAFEIPSSTDYGNPIAHQSFTPNYFESVSDADISSKLLAARSYGSETPEFPHPRSTKSLEALAAVRGSQAGEARAEAFHIYRQVSK